MPFFTMAKKKSNNKSNRQGNQQQPEHDGLAAAAAATNSSNDKKKAPVIMTRAPGGTGTFSVARGLSAQQVKETRRELESKLKSSSSTSSTTTTTAAATISKEVVERHLWGNQPDVAKDRLRLLQKDDANPKLDGLNDKQKHALQKRNNKNQSGNRNNSSSGKDKVLTAKLQHYETKRLQAAVAAADAESILQTTAVGCIETEHDMERTSSLTQAALKQQVDPEIARHIYDLELTDCAPYGMEYDRSGRYSILFGKSRGHLAIMDNIQQTLSTEFYINERIRDATFLHNHSLFAVAQKNHTYIYDNTGAEIHVLQSHSDPLALQFLPHHWLLASLGRAGWLKYQDTSTGQLISQHATSSSGTASASGTPPAHLMRQNPANAIIHAGHANGTVTLWSPAQSQYLVKMHCHKGASITSLAIHQTGMTMVTGGADGRIRIWDLRMYQQAKHDYYCGFIKPPTFYTNCSAGIGQIIAPTSIDFSQRGLLAVGHGNGHVTIWPADAIQTKVRDPYMHHHVVRGQTIQTVRFRPYEDVCGVGHGRGITSMVVPGSGEPHLDTAEYHVNPAADTKQRREMEVRALLDKLQPEMIVLDPNQVGGMEESNPHVRHERLQDIQAAAASQKTVPVKKQTTKKRGRSKIQTKLRRRQKNIIDQNTVKLKQAREEEKAQGKQERFNKNSTTTITGSNMNAKMDTDHHDEALAAPPKALERFFT